jgi:hypothetical protein
MRALLGAVFPQLRGVYVSVENALWRVHFYVDGVISDDDRESLTIAATEMVADLPHGFGWEEQIVRLDAPARPPATTDWDCVFFRKEPYLSD